MIKAHYFTIIVAVIGIALVVLLFRRLRRKQNSTATPVSAD
jgi:formate-dependent nitrite reductase membrane component NrfD